MLESVSKAHRVQKRHRVQIGLDEDEPISHARLAESAPDAEVGSCTYTSYQKFRRHIVRYVTKIRMAQMNGGVAEVHVMYASL
jgi:hypothetical protein